ncbi:MAG: phosphate ABC transporter substrate-binding protein PstS [Acidobacteriaceae bacterium]
MRYRALLFVCLAVMVLGVAGCNSKRQPETLRAIPAAGSSFVFPVMQRWGEDFFELHRPTQVVYVADGSVKAVEELAAGKVAFAATDYALTPKQLGQLPPVIQVPVTAGAICITYNLPGLKQPLRLSAGTLAGIFLGTVKRWNDPAIAKDNPGVVLPDEAITVVHRADAAGATDIFTTYLSKVNPQWASKVGSGDSVKWPVGIGGEGSAGLTSVVRNSPGTIGYVELNYAQQNELPVAAVENRAGRYVVPNVASTKAAVEAFAAQLRANLDTAIVDPPATAGDAYPIAGLSFMIVPRDGANVVERTALGKFMVWVLHNGQDTAFHLGYARLPQSLVAYDEAALRAMTAGGKPILH